MTRKKFAKITALGAFLPPGVLTNQDLEKMVDTSDEWITTRTGIKERRIAGENEYTSSMAIESAKKIIENSAVTASQIDAIIVTTMTPDFISPSTAAIVQDAIGAVNASALDIQAACTGFLYGLSIAKAWAESGAFKNILLISSEKNSAFIDYEDRNTCVLFGDGSGGCLVQLESNDPNALEIREISLGADGSECSLLEIPAGGSKAPASHETVNARSHYIKMFGKEIFKHAVRRMESASKACLQKAEIPESAISWIIPHQANIRIIEAIQKRFDLPDERMVKTIQKYGNTSSATIPISLYELQNDNKINDGDYLLLTAFGGGLTWGSAILKKGTNE